MKKLSKALILILALCLVLCSCGNEEETGKKEESDPTPTPVVKNYYTITFMQDDQVLSTQSNVLEGSQVPEPQINTPEDDNIIVEIKGWDANDDGIAETFPYEISGDTTFKLLYTVTSRSCHYDIYVGGVLYKSVDANYGDPIDYPQVQSSINGDNVNIFVGWKYDGVYDGYTYNYVTKSCRIDAYFADSQILKMYYGDMLYAKYVPYDQVLTFLNDWGVTSPEGKQIKWYTDSSYTTPFASSKMIMGNLNLYGRAEEIVVSVSDSTSVSSQSELLSIFNGMVLNRITEGKFSLGFSVSSIDELINYLVTNGLQAYNYQANASLKGKELSLQLTFEPAAIMNSGSAVYTQLSSYNFKGYANSRSSSYNDFASEKRSSTFNVATSDALFYALEHGYKPVIDSSATGVAAIYEKMKTALRTCVSDSMSNVEKAKAIYEYLIMETTYDAKVLDLVKNGATGMGAYNAFYLEGVFNDHLAVCDGISKAYACLCQMEGIECVRVTGITTSGVNHAWNKIKIDGSWYVVDVTSGGCISGNNEVLTYSYFMLSDSAYSTYATEDGKYFAGYTASSTYDIYGKLGIKASSKEEAANLFKSFNQNAGSGKTSFDIKLAYSYSDMKSAIEAIMAAANYTGQINYIEGKYNNVIIVLSK